MKIIFLGGCETVTGSKFLVETKTTRVLVDCGLYQGYKWLRRRNWQPLLSVDVNQIDAILLTHAHLDHSGYIPVLYKQGYRGPVITHRATKELCAILLADSGHIQEEDARFYRKYKLSKHEEPEPLYDRATADKSMELFEAVEYEDRFTVGDIKVYLQNVGHILGAASIIIEAEGKKIGFSGDVGRPDDVLMRPPNPLPDLDLLLLESTYGNRRHDKTDQFQQLSDVVNETSKAGGVLLIPCFAVGRAQTLQHMLVTLLEAKRIPKLPIYLDSPMAINVSDIYRRYSYEHRLTPAQCHSMGQKITYTRSVEESKAIAEMNFPHIIIAGSGMVTGGRILHHLKQLLPDHRTTVLFTGYQAGGTRGAKMQEGMESVKIHGEWIPNHARIEVMNGLSGHGDFVDIEQWLKQSSLRKDMPIKLIHGDPDALEGMRDHLRRTTNFDIEIAGYQSILTV
ncbi:MBL fold metallo-hydrolase [Photobacterium lipolyticum]|uniref:MBL fold metallo-hydrolase n=1 Tax=Photobacterium lipolyticum TaxID=266810 RepID=A0A2T3N2Y5_9GAMM|nr:MBL fold metallo-hydrolase [Photobacterium lipolyticum]PSW06688.1 MBL fold metallo-hydrolase [Photobacterium lipolyticum]